MTYLISELGGLLQP